MSTTKPRCIVACVLYFLDENPASPSWASGVISALGNDDDPSVLQSLIRSCYHNGTCGIEVEGVQVLPVPLFRYMDGKDSRDYAQRVEPSSRGGHKMARAVMEALIYFIDP